MNPGLLVISYKGLKIFEEVTGDYSQKLTKIWFIFIQDGYKAF